MNREKTYNKPEMEIVLFVTSDVVTASDGWYDTEGETGVEVPEFQDV